MGINLMNANMGSLSNSPQTNIYITNPAGSPNPIDLGKMKVENVKRIILKGKTFTINDHSNRKTFKDRRRRNSPRNES